MPLVETRFIASGSRHFSEYPDHHPTLNAPGTTYPFIMPAPSPLDAINRVSTKRTPKIVNAA